MGKGKKRLAPRRERKRTMPTISEGPLKVAIATTPKDHDGRGQLANDVELTKAALLYADEVELVSFGVSMMDELRVLLTSSEYGGFNLLAALDDETIRHLQQREGEPARELPANWREMFGLLAVVPDELAAAMPDQDANVLRELQDTMREMGKTSRKDMETVMEQLGGTELLPAIQSGVVRVADLGATPAKTLRPTDLPDQSDEVLWNWLDALASRLQDRRTRVLFDDESANLIRLMVEGGQIPQHRVGLRLAAEAAFGTGFVARLPAFPTAKMDELLDLRSDLAKPLTRFRGAMTRFSKDVPPVFGPDLASEVEAVWRGTVAPALVDLEEQIVDHGLVREVAKQLDVPNIGDFAYWTGGTYLAVTTQTNLDAVVSGALSAIVGAGGPMVLDAWRAKREGQRVAKASEFFYLYEANKRMS